MSAALIAGGVLGGSLIGAGSQQKTNEEMMNFAYNMSSTQYQRAVEDMRAAGLNPVLSAGTGGASSSTPGLTAPGKDVASGFANAARTMAIDVPQAEANIHQQEAATRVADQEVKNRKATEALTREQELLTRVNRAIAQSNAKITAAQVPAAEAKAGAWSIVAPSLKEGGPKIGEGIKDTISHTPTSLKPLTKQSDGSWKQGNITIPKSSKEWAEIEANAKGRKTLTPSEAYATGRGTVYGGKASAK